MDEGQILDIVVRKYNLILDTIADILVVERPVIIILNACQNIELCPHEMAYLISNGLFVSRDSSCITTKELPPGDVLDLGMLNFTGRRFEHAQFKHNTSFQGVCLKGLCSTSASLKQWWTSSTLIYERPSSMTVSSSARLILLPGANTKDAVLPDNVRDYLEQL